MKRCKSVEKIFFYDLIKFFFNIYLKLTNHGYFMIKNPLFVKIHNKNGVLLYNFKSKWPYPESNQSTGNPLFTMTTSQRACKPVITTRAFSRRNQHRAKALCWKSRGSKKVLVILGCFPSNKCCQFSMISRIWEKITFNRAQDVVRKPLVYSAHCG